eukprot:SAG25_NODE_807_length_5249_cov_3.894369_6_plen_144_part_00
MGHRCNLVAACPIRCVHQLAGVPLSAQKVRQRIPAQVIREVFQSFAQTQQVSDVLDKEEMVGGNFDEFDDFQISGDEGAEGTDTASGGKQKGKATKGSGGGGKKPATKKPAAKRGAPKKPAPKKTSKNAVYPLCPYFPAVVQF